MQSILGITNTRTHAAHTVTGSGPRFLVRCRAFLLAAMFMMVAASEPQAQQLIWTDQFGTFSGEHAAGVGATADGIFVAGQIDGGALPGQVSAGSSGIAVCLVTRAEFMTSERRLSIAVPKWTSPLLGPSVVQVMVAEVSVTFVTNTVETIESLGSV